MKTYINLAKPQLFANISLNIVIFILLWQLTSASQVFFFHNITKYTSDGGFAEFMSWIVPFALESGTGIVIYKTVEIFGIRAKKTAIFILLPIFFVLTGINYETSQAGILAKGLDEVQKTAPRTVERLKEVEDRYLSQLNKVSGGYQIISTSHLDRQINQLEEDLEANQKETDNCRCPAWREFQNAQKAKRNDLSKRINRLENSKLGIMEQNNLASKMQASQAAPIQEAMKKALEKAEEQNKKDELAFEERKTNKTQTIQAVHGAISLTIILLSIVKALVKNPEVTLSFEKSLTKTFVSKPEVLQAKKPKDFKEDFLELIYTSIYPDEILRLTDKQITEILLKNQKLDGQESALTKNINDWRKNLVLTKSTAPTAQSTPTQINSEKNEPTQIKSEPEVPEGIKTKLRQYFDEGKNFAFVKTVYTNGNFQNLIPKMKQIWDGFEK